MKRLPKFLSLLAAAALVTAAAADASYAASPPPHTAPPPPPPPPHTAPRRPRRPHPRYTWRTRPSWYTGYRTSGRSVPVPDKIEQRSQAL